MAHLQRNHEHEDLLILVGEDVFDESPAGADQHDCDKQDSTFQSFPENKKDAGYWGTE